MKPKKKSSDNGEISLSKPVDKCDTSMLAAMFPGLSIPNNKRRVLSSSEQSDNEDQKEVDGMMAALESLQPLEQQWVSI